MEFHKFKKIVYAVCIGTSSKAGEFQKSGITPNFHACEIKKSETALFILCSINGDWAFSNSSEPELNFIDDSELADILSEQFRIDVISSDILNGPFSSRPHMLESDINYWRPKTLGEALFNWWD